MSNFLMRYIHGNCPHCNREIVLAEEDAYRNTCLRCQGCKKHYDPKQLKGGY